MHWQVADWHTRDQANIRIRQLMGDDARYFAPVYVTHLRVLLVRCRACRLVASFGCVARRFAGSACFIEGLRAKALAKYPNQQQRIDQIFTRPNDDFVFIRKLADGWFGCAPHRLGFANFHRAYGGSIIDAPADDSLRQVKVCFSMMAAGCPTGEFDLWRSTSWAHMKTDSEGYFDLGFSAPARGFRCATNDRKERIETVADDTR